MRIFFLNSTNRAYNDKELNKVPQILFTQGIFNTTQSTRALWKTSGDLLVEGDSESMTITARAGAAAITALSGGVAQRILAQEDNSLSAVVSANSDLANRNDAVVIRINQAVINEDTLNSGGTNAASLVVVAGNGADELTDAQIATALGGDPFVRLANILVPQNTEAITPAMITDARELVKTSRGVSLGGDTFQFFSLTSDPVDLAEGMVWYNITEGILKFYDGENTIALQTQDFTWGYYPPNGVDGKGDTFDSITKNDSDESVQEREYNRIYFDGNYYTNMVLQGIIMPDVEAPFMRIKLGSKIPAVDLAVKIYTANADFQPVSLVETFSFSDANVPVNDYIDLLLTENYSPGSRYAIVLQMTNISFNAIPARANVLTSSNDEAEYLYGIKTAGDGVTSGGVTDPLAMSWGTGMDSGRQFIMEIGSKGEQVFGQTDIADNTNKLSQAFTAKSKDIIGFNVIKGEDVGTPTGNVRLSLYNADEQNNPTGGVLAESVIEEADWQGASQNDQLTFEMNYVDLVVGSRYVMILEMDDESDTDTYSVVVGESELGAAKRYNNADGWINLGVSLFYETITSAVQKIVVTNAQGKVPSELIDYPAKRFIKVVSDTAPFLDTDTFDEFEVSALAGNINFSTNMIGNPVDGEQKVFWIKDDNNSRNITWPANFEAMGASLPASTTANKWHRVVVVYRETTAKFGCISATVQA